jgi:hypothetical protein
MSKEQKVDVVVEKRPQAAVTSDTTLLYPLSTPSALEKKNAPGLPSCPILRTMVLVTLITENSRIGLRTTLSETEQ